MAHIETIGKYQIWESDGHGRSVGTKGNYNKKTTGIQVRKYGDVTDGYLLKKTFNYKIGDVSERAAKLFLAREFIKNQP